ncbi:hypothetical protein G6F40_014873 [Rhizopus arrhizus]|nr:hypothetical protein G6F40_014873 [Rhizopus arrhizus]
MAAHLRRMAVLLVIGLLHSVLLWWGDILLVYALVGLLMPLFRHLGDRALRCSGLVLARLLPHGAGCPHVHRAGPAYRQQSHQFVLRIRQQRGEQFGAVLRQGFARHLLQFAQRHGSGRFRPVRCHAFQPVLHFQAHAQRQVVAVVAAVQNGLHHAMHQRGQRHLRMLRHFDL